MSITALSDEWAVSARAIWNDLGRGDPTARQLWRSMWLDSSSMSVDQFAEAFQGSIASWLDAAGYRHDPEWVWELAVELWAIAKGARS